jgi:UDP-glucose 4-epimerase
VSTDRANTGGTLNVLVAARDEGVRRVVVASSSSVYGGVAPQPTPEEAELTPKSPYAVSKVAGEHYARVFWELFGLETVRFRYFNVFGPRQRPDSPYAAVIPLFAQAILDGRQPEIHGDGLQSRDFTYIDDVVEANRRAISAPSDVVAGKVYNIAQGKSTTILGLWEELARIAGSELQPSFTSPRPGDVRSSLASIDRAAADLGFRAAFEVPDGVERFWTWMSGAGCASGS